ncbi:hypothetical protein AcW1_005582 [Taiwanofungus camphoratus]|nr:hypothetical protein AcW1_005582 [Antrodia cinnamomea]
MRSQIKLYEHPDFSVDKADLSLLSTICCVLGLAVAGAAFVLAMSCLLFWDECWSSHTFMTQRPQYMPVRRFLSR